MRNVIALSVVMATLLTTGCDDGPGAEALGTLERDHITLKATANEILLQQPIPEGTAVTAGVLLAQLDDRRQQVKVAKAGADVAAATAQLEELRNGARPEDIARANAEVAGARAALTEAESSYARAQQLLAQKLAAQAAVDSALAIRDSQEAHWHAAREELLRLTNGTRKEQLDRAEAVLLAAQAQLDLEQHNLSELSIVATRDAYLDSLPWNVGERVTKGSTIAVLLANAAPYARVYIPEPYRARLRIGDTRQIAIDGIDKMFRGHLRWIAKDPSFTPYYGLNATDRARLVYLAEFDIDDATELPTGVPAQVKLGND